MTAVRSASLSRALWIFLVFSKLLLGGESDSLAYIFQQDNLSSANDLKLHYSKDFKNLSWDVQDLLRYKLFAFESAVSEGEQYSVEHQLQTDLSWGPQRRKNLRLESNQFQDHRTGLASNILNQAVLAGYSHQEKFGFFLGTRIIERYGIVDRGWTSELNYHDRWQQNRQRTGFRLTGRRDDLEEHASHSARTQADYEIRFGEISNFRSVVAYDNRLQSFYTDSLGSSQSRLNENFHWLTNFDYSLSKELALYHKLTWDNQFTEISQVKVGAVDTIALPGQDRQRFSLVNETGLSLKRDKFTALTAFKIENSQNKYYVDYTQRLYQLREDLLWVQSGLVDSVAWSSYISRLEYDTPDTTNDDDRDELRFNTELRLIWQPSPFYHVEVGSKVSLFHLVYLFNTRSSENHWNRNLLLWSGLKWQQDKWSGESRGRIRSNYFAYDYDDLFLELEQPTRSFVHRSLELQQSFQYRFSNRWSATVKVAGKWEDEGQLDWNAFVQQVRSQREQEEVVIKLYYDYRGWKGWVGYLNHDRITRYTALNRDSEKWYGQGPLLGLQRSLGYRLYVNADARFIQVKDQNRDYLLPKVFFTLVYR